MRSAEDGKCQRYSGWEFGGWTVEKVNVSKFMICVGFRILLPGNDV